MGISRSEPMKIVISEPPRTKKNHSQIIRVNGRQMVIPSKQYLIYETICSHFMPDVSLHGLFSLKVLYYMPTHRRVDLTNLLQATCDILVKYGVLEDDNSKVIRDFDGSRVLYDKENPRTEIYISEVKDG